MWSIWLLLVVAVARLQVESGTLVLAVAVLVACLQVLRVLQQGLLTL
jgi:hypothetical protein